MQELYTDEPSIESNANNYVHDVTPIQPSIVDERSEEQEELVINIEDDVWVIIQPDVEGVEGDNVEDGKGDNDMQPFEKMYECQMDSVNTHLYVSSTTQKIPVAKNQQCQSRK